MHSKVAKRLLDKMPEHIKLFTDEYFIHMINPNGSIIYKDLPHSVYIFNETDDKEEIWITLNNLGLNNMYDNSSIDQYTIIEWHNKDLVLYAYRFNRFGNQSPIISNTFEEFIEPFIAAYKIRLDEIIGRLK